MTHTRQRLLFATVAAVLAATFIVRADGTSGSGSVSITTAAGITENFNSLAASGTSNSLPTGWYVTEIGTGAAADGSYVAGDGTSNAGNAYSFGTSSASTDRALGSVGSGGVSTIRYGAKFTNNTGFIITGITVQYTGEMWRQGTTGTMPTPDQLTFAYSTDATNLSTGTFTAVPSLTFNSPDINCSTTASAAASKIDGNSANCHQTLSATISGVTIPNGGFFWLRWTDVDSAGNDDGLAIDDVSVSVTSSLSTTASASPTPVAPGGTVTLSGNLNPGQNPASQSYSVVCDLSAFGGSATQSLPVNGAVFSYDQAIAASQTVGGYSVQCRVTDDQARFFDFSIPVKVLFPLNPTCGALDTPIHTVQGAGATSPIVGETVDIEGIVVGAFQGSSRLQGFYLEEPDATQDSDPATSEGIFVFTGANPPTLYNVGDRVRIRGVVAEFQSQTAPLVSNLTELGNTSNATVCAMGQPLPTPATVTLPTATPTDLERYEGMLVQFNQQLVVTGEFNLGTFGQIDLAPSVLYQPTQTPGNTATWQAIADLNARSKIALDDGSTSSNANLNGGGVAPYPPPGLSAANTLRVGALVNPNNTPAPFGGILDDRFGAYRIEPTDTVTFSNAPNPRPDTSAVTAALGGRFRVASANVLNYFTTLGSRGAQNATEQSNQRAKMLAALSKLNSDIYGLSEVQNFSDGQTDNATNTYSNVTVADIVAGLAAATGRNYQFIDTINPANVVGGDITQNGTDAIRNVIIYDAARVTPVGLAALRYQNDGNRPSLAQTFKPATGAKADSQTFTVVVNHFRSKGSACGGASDDPLQGNCNGMRLSMANNVQGWLDTNPTADPAGANRKYLLIGDYNAYFGEDPIQSFVANSVYTDLINLILGPNASSYNFGSQDGYLDHGIVNKAFLPLIKTVAELHTNAEEPAALEALDSNLKSATAQVQYFAANEFAASDHDPFVVALNPLAGDLNDDGVIDLADRNIIVGNYGKPASQVDRRMDYDGDGLITTNDYRIWFNYYRAFNQ